jgi:hypothetical protein
MWLKLPDLYDVRNIDAARFPRNRWACPECDKNIYGFPVVTLLPDALVNHPYALSLSEKRLARVLSKLNVLIDLIERDEILDKERFQLLFESHWLSTNASRGMLLLPTWNLCLFSALHSESLRSDTETYTALEAVAQELRN